jgi:hypothetical protein
MKSQNRVRSKKEKMMKKQETLCKAVLILILASMASMAWADPYSGGTGEPTDPYQINTTQDLIDLGETTGDYDKSFILTADIDLDPGENPFEQAVIAPDTDAEPEFQGVPFSGSFDGDGHIIHNLTIVSNDGIGGLFGKLASTAKVLDLGVVDVNVTSNSVAGLVGGLAALNEGRISSSYSTGTVMANGSVIGGLVGHNLGTIVNCYSRCDVTGLTQVGGLVGLNTNEGNLLDCTSNGLLTNCDIIGIIINCYSTGNVIGGSPTGGLVGYLTSGTVQGCFWNTDTSGQSNSAGGEGLDTAQMQDIETYLYACWDLVGETEYGTDDTWYVPQDDYPILHYSDPNVTLNALDLVATEDDGTIICIDTIGDPSLLPGETTFGDANRECAPYLAGNADDLDLGTIAVCDRQSLVETKFTPPADRVAILIAGQGQLGLIRVYDATNMLTGRILFDSNSFNVTGYLSNKMPVRGVLVESKNDIGRIEILPLTGKTLNLTLVSIVAVQGPTLTKAATEAGLASLDTIKASGGTITSINGTKTNNLILGDTFFPDPPIQPILSPASNADNFELDSVANTFCQTYAQTTFQACEPIAIRSVFLIVRPVDGALNTGQIHLLDGMGQPQGKPVAYTQTNFINLGHESNCIEAQGLVVSGNGYFYGIRIVPDTPEALAFDVASVSALEAFPRKILFEEDFASGTTTGWVNDVLPGKIDSSAARGSYSYTIDAGNGKHFSGVSYPLDNLVPDQVEFYVKSDSTETNDGYFVIGESTSVEDIAAFFYMNDKGQMGLVYCENGQEIFVSKPYVADVWYKITLIMDWANRVVEFRVNDECDGVIVPFRGDSVEMLKAVYLYNYSEISQAWWDEIKFTSAWLTLCK